MKRLLSIVIPVYYNEPSLPRLFTGLGLLRKALAARNVGLQLIFVDDGSEDGSFERLRAYKAQRKDVTLVKLTRNFGAVHASKTGFGFVKGHAFMIMAADLQDPPELILQMVDCWRKGSKFVVAERFTRDDPWLSKAYSRLYYLLVRAFVLPGYPQGGYDMALMDRAMLKPMYNSSKSVFTPLLGWWLGFKPTVLHYHRPAREHGRSGWTFAKKYHAFLDVMLGFSITPIRAISGVGAVVSMSAFAYGINISIAALRGQVPVQGFSTLVALMTFLLGLIILMLGVIGEYLWRIYEELNHRPETVIEEVL